MFIVYSQLSKSHIFFVPHFTFSFKLQGFYEFSHRGYGGAAMTKALSNHLVTKPLKLWNLVKEWIINVNETSRENYVKKVEEFHSSKIGQKIFLGNFIPSKKKIVFVSL